MTLTMFTIKLEMIIAIFDIRVGGAAAEAIE